MTNHLTGCLDCGNCRVCPTGVDIPACLTTYDNAIKSGDKDNHQKIYDSIIKFMRAHNCIGCGRCEPKCPINIKIIDELEIVANYFK